MADRPENQDLTFTDSYILSIPTHVDDLSRLPHAVYIVNLKSGDLVACNDACAEIGLTAAKNLKGYVDADDETGLRLLLTGQSEESLEGTVNLTTMKINGTQTNWVTIASREYALCIAGCEDEPELGLAETKDSNLRSEFNNFRDFIPLLATAGYIGNKMVAERLAVSRNPVNELQMLKPFFDLSVLGSSSAIRHLGGQLNSNPDLQLPENRQAAHLMHDFGGILLRAHAATSIVSRFLSPANYTVEGRADKTKELMRAAGYGFERYLQLSDELATLGPDITLNLRPTNIINLIGETAEVFNSLNERIEIFTQFEYSEALEHANVDGPKIRRVIENLITNALRYTESGQIIISGKADGTNYEIEMRVSDTGIGINPDNLEAIMESEVQLEAGQKGAHGYGLEICSKIIAAHNGRIWAESDGEVPTDRLGMDTGATFVIRIPI